MAWAKVAENLNHYTNKLESMFVYDSGETIPQELSAAKTKADDGSICIDLKRGRVEYKVDGTWTAWGADNL